MGFRTGPLLPKRRLVGGGRLETRPGGTDPRNGRAVVAYRVLDLETNKEVLIGVAYDDEVVELARKQVDIIAALQVGPDVSTTAHKVDNDGGA